MSTRMEPRPRRTPQPTPPVVGDYLSAEDSHEHFLKQGRQFLQDLQRWLVANNHLHRSMAIIQAFTRAHDRLIQAAYQHACRQWSEETGLMPPRVAVLAIGGYGRRTLMLRSDIDLMVLMAEHTGDNERFVKSLMLTLIDLKLNLGYATRTQADCLAALGNDLDSATAMTESRLLAGHRPLFNEFMAALAAALQGRWRRWFIRSVHQQMLERRRKYESTVYMLEPNLKEGNGGLRDAHTVMWILFALTGSLKLRQLIALARFTEEDFRRLREALTMLRVIRNEIHITAESKTDQLIFTCQPLIAERLGYQSTDIRSAEEVFMADYYRHARTVERLTHRAVRVLLHSDRSVWDGVVGSLKRRRLDRYHFVQDNVLFIDDAHQDYLEQEPRRILELFERAAKWGYRLSDRTLDRITRAAAGLGPGFRLDPANHAAFMRLLRGPFNVHRALADMHETGVLAKFLPEFERLRYMVRIDHYHHYTVDEHTFRALEEAERLQRLGSGSGDHVAEVAASIKRWDLLNLALLLHDIGKGYGRGHALRGGHIAQRVGDRMGLKRADTDLVRFLVLSHLKLTHASQRRDLSDPAVARALAEEIGSLERLKMLYVHTVCDLRAVSPDAWNDWKGQLLAECYARTAEMLAGERRAAGGAQPELPRLKREILALLLDGQARKAGARRAGDPELERDLDEFLGHVSQRYIRNMSPRQIGRHFLLRRQLQGEQRVAWELDPRPEGGYNEILVAAHDTPGLFSNICGALAAKGISIWSAEIFSTNDGYALNQFRVTDLDNRPLAGGLRLDRLRDDLDDVLQERKTIFELIAKHRTRRRRKAVAKAVYPTSVRFDNDSSQHHTVIEIRSTDRPGLLFWITRALNASRLDIHRSIIATEAYGVVDVFYVTDLEYNKIHDRHAQEKIRATILDHVEQAAEMFAG